MFDYIKEQSVNIEGSLMQSIERSVGIEIKNIGYKLPLLLANTALGALAVLLVM